MWKHPDTDVLREGGAGPFWVLSRHVDLRAVNRDTETFIAFDGAQIRDTAENRKGKMLISMDGPPPRGCVASYPVASPRGCSTRSRATSGGAPIASSTPSSRRAARSTSFLTSRSSSRST